MTVNLVITDANEGACDGSAAVTASGGGGAPYSYQWNDPNNSTSAIVSGLCAGTFEVTITDDEGCTTVETVVIDEIVGTGELALVGQLRVFPNPTSGRISIVREGVNGMVQWTLLNAIGQVARTGSITAENQRTDIDLSDVGAGVYFLRLQREDGQQVIKLVVE